MQIPFVKGLVDEISAGRERLSQKREKRAMQISKDAQQIEAPRGKGGVLFQVLHNRLKMNSIAGGKVLGAVQRIREDIDGRYVVTGEGKVHRIAT